MPMNRFYDQNCRRVTKLMIVRVWLIDNDTNFTKVYNITTTTTTINYLLVCIYVYVYVYYIIYLPPTPLPIRYPNGRGTVLSSSLSIDLGSFRVALL